MKFNQSQQEGSPILVYYRLRGKAQSVRKLLCHLQFPFYQIYLQEYRTTKQSLPKYVTATLKGLKINITELPLLIHQDLFIYGTYPIMAYLCRFKVRQDLLGADVFRKAKVQEMIQIYLDHQSNVQAEGMKLAELAHTLQGNQLIQKKRQTFASMMNHSRYVRQLCQYLQKSQRPEFVFQQLTIIDFYFLQNIRYMLGGFSDLRSESKQEINEDSSPLLKKVKQNIHYLQIMQNFKQRMIKLPFYSLHKDYFESMPFTNSLMSMEKREGLKKLFTLQSQNQQYSL